MRQRKYYVETQLTNSTASLAAKARISAQETVPGQKISSTFLVESITGNPPREVFAGSVRSVAFPSNNTDPSQPFGVHAKRLNKSLVSWK